MRKLVRCAVFVITGASFALAQAQHREKVVFNCTCNDAVGALYATALRDLFANSPRFVEAFTAEEKDKAGKVSGYNWKISVVSMDPSADNLGHTAALSVVFLLGDYGFVSQWIQICSRPEVKGCAEATLANFDAAMRR